MKLEGKVLILFSKYVVEHYNQLERLIKYDYECGNIMDNNARYYLIVKLNGGLMNLSRFEAG
jgi:hypothetical protein